MSLPAEITGREAPARDGSALDALIDFYRAFNASDLKALAANWADGEAPSMEIRLVVSGEDGLPSRKGMRSCLADQRLSAWRSAISQRRVTMTTISSLDAKKASAKLPLFASSFEFAHPDGSSRRVARGGKSITMGLSTSQRCWLTTSARFLERLSGRHLKLRLRGSA
jgi:hypothetical protein